MAIPPILPIAFDEYAIFIHEVRILCMVKVRKPSSRGAKKASLDEVDLMLQVAELYNTDYDFEAKEWFWGEYKEKSFEEFKSKYPQGSKEYQFFERFTSRFELEGILIEHGLLNEDLYYDRYGSIKPEWEKSKSVVYGLRKEWGEPRYRENFELLATGGEKWSEKHPPKITDVEKD